MPDDIQDPTQDQPNPLAALLGLIVQARAQWAPEQQAPLPQVLGPAGTPSNLPWQSIQPQKPQSISDFLPDATKNTPANNASSASVIHEGEKRQQQNQHLNPLLDDEGRVDPNRMGSGWFRQQFNNPGSQYYGGSPAKRMLQNFMIGLAALGGHEVPSLYQTKREEWQTDLKTAMEQETKDTQQQRVDDVQKRAEARAAQQMKIALMKEADFQQTFGFKKEVFNFQKQRWQELQAAREKQAQGKALNQKETELVKGYGPAADQVLLEWRQSHPELQDQDIIGQPQFLKDVQQRELTLKPQQREDELTDKLVASGADVKGLASADPAKRIEVVQASKLPPEEKNFLIGRIIQNKTLINAQATTNRANILADNRIVPAVDSRTDQIGITTGKEVRQEPFGTYGPPGPVQKAVDKGAIFTDMHSNFDRLREAWQAMPDSVSNTFRAKLAYIMSETKQSAIHDFITGKAVEGMAPEEQRLVIRMGMAMENVLAMRGVAGFGAGSDMMRAAIQRTVPSGTSANRAYALEQMDAIDNMLNNLQQGQLQFGDLTPRRPDISGGGAAPAAPAASTSQRTILREPQAPPRPGSPSQGLIREQQNQKTGAYRWTNDGGKTWQAGRKPRQ